MNGQGYLHADGQQIKDRNNNPVILRGLGLGGYMVQEGYMLKTSDFAGPQHQIRQHIVDLIGEDKTKEFYEAYYQYNVTKKDIDSLKAWGFNSVRLPLHYNLFTPPIQNEKVNEITWIEKGFQMTDSILKWCAANEMYLILDLHAAPGGQGQDANISDYDDSNPSLWEEKANRDKMVALWKKLAIRYKDEPWIGAYDILNEPNWNFTGENLNGCDETSNAPLRALYLEVTEAIREVDTNHIIIIEGNCWGNNYEGIFPLWDDNMVVSFHKYWNYNTQNSIQRMLDYRTKYNVPIWLGESGENSNVWFTEAIRLVETNNVGWAFWPMKKIDNIAGVTSVTKTKDYQILLDYWNNQGEKPSTDFAYKTLMELAELYDISRVTVKPDVLDAMFRQINDPTSLPFKQHSIPGIIYASEYDLGPINTAYFDSDATNYWVDSGERTSWNKGNSMRNDGVDIQPCMDKITNGFEVFDIKKNEWLTFTVNIITTGNYRLSVRYRQLAKPTIIELLIDGKSTSTVHLTASEDYTTSKGIEIPLTQGKQILKLRFSEVDFKLNYIELGKPVN